MGCKILWLVSLHLYHPKKSQFWIHGDNGAWPVWDHQFQLITLTQLHCTFKTTRTENKHESVMNVEVQIQMCTYLSQFAKIQINQQFAHTVLDLIFLSIYYVWAEKGCKARKKQYLKRGTISCYISLPHKPAVWHVLLDPLVDISCRQCKSCVDVPDFIELHFLMTWPITLFGPLNKTCESSGKFNW